MITRLAIWALSGFGLLSAFKANACDFPACHSLEKQGVDLRKQKTA
jgi:hypothetical protein